MKIYARNNIPCIYLWPDNLGTLEWILKRRLREVLLKYKKHFILLTFELSDYLSHNGLTILALAMLTYFVKDVRIQIGLAIIQTYFLYTTSIKYVNRILKLKKSPWVSNNKYPKEESTEN